MPTISIDKQSFLDKLDTRLTDDDLRSELSQLGTDVENITDEEITVEIFPNRPDLLSSQGLARNLKGLLGETTSMPHYDVKPSEKEVSVDESVTNVRPYTSCAVVTNVSFDQTALEDLIELQEKIHVTYGRNRRECALGLYPLDSVAFPITYTAKNPEYIEFAPLGSLSPMKAETILEEHEKGQEYGELLDGYDKYPVFIDDNDNVLSMPPIINSEYVGRVTTKTTGLFIECSGFQPEKLHRALNIVCADLADQGATIHRVHISQDDGGESTPTLDKSDSHSVSKDDVNKWLGTNLTKDAIVNSAEKMRFDASAENGKNIDVSNPKYRIDLQGKSDIIEDIAIGYGYNNIEVDNRRSHSNGSKDMSTRRIDKARRVVEGAGYQELYTFSLCNYSTMEKLSEQNTVKLKNSLSDRFNALRSSLIPQHLDVLSDNTHYAYPQLLYETGKVFLEDDSQNTGVSEPNMLCLTSCGREDNFSRVQQLLQTVANRFDTDLSFQTTSHPCMINGRSSSIITNNDTIGVFGEVHPKILSDFGITQPVVVAEIYLEPLTQH
jgi:phenylalanyl-tRNA synthetase beta chain